MQVLFDRYSQWLAEPETGKSQEKISLYPILPVQ
jgi:hypothetical protein